MVRACLLCEREDGERARDAQTGHVFAVAEDGVDHVVGRDVLADHDVGVVHLRGQESVSLFLRGGESAEEEKGGRTL